VPGNMLERLNVNSKSFPLGTSGCGNASGPGTYCVFRSDGREYQLTVSLIRD
jgi:hypothetical protein